MCSELLEKDTGEGGEEVDVSGSVKPLLQVGCNGLEVLRIRFEEVDDWNIGDRVPCAANVPAQLMLNIVYLREARRLTCAWLRPLTASR